MYQIKYLRNTIEFRLFDSVRLNEFLLVQSTYLNLNFYCTNEKLLDNRREN